jgi:sarcosine oxidase subunit gamma
MLEATSIWIKPAAARLILQGDAQARNLAAAVWGVPFCEESCRALSVGERATLWLGPEEHLLLQESRDSALPIAELEQAMADHPHSLVDVSHRQIAIELSGPDAALLLSGACPLDFDLRELPVQMCTRTVLAKAEIVLWRRAPEVFHLEVWRSFQSYVLELLHEIAGSYSGV